MAQRRMEREAVAELLEAFQRRRSLTLLRAVLGAAARAGTAAEVRAHLIEALEAEVDADPRLLYRLYLEDGQDVEAAAAARRLGEASALLEVAEGCALRFRMLALQLYLESADLLARQGHRRAYGRAAAVLCRLRAAMEGEEVRWEGLFSGYCARHRRRRALLQELVRAGLDPGSPPPVAEMP